MISPRFAHRREHAGARPDHHAGRARADAPPLLGALGVAERGVQDGHAVAEAGEELPGHRRGERDLRHQQQRAAADRQRRFDRVQIDLGLARTGDAVQQERLERPRLHRRADRIERGLLMRVENVRRAVVLRGDRRQFRLQGEQPFARQSPRCFARVADGGLHIFEVVRSRVQIEIGQQLALGFLVACPPARAPLVRPSASPPAREKGRAATRDLPAVRSPSSPVRGSTAAPSRSFWRDTRRIAAAIRAGSSVERRGPPMRRRRY